MADRLLISLTRRLMRLRVSRHRWDGAGLLRTPTEPVCGVDVEAPESVSRVGLAADDGISRLSGLGWRPPKQLRVEVQLGLQHAVVGLLRLENATKHSFRQQATYVRAWVCERLHLDPDANVIRWQILADGEGVLVSCIDRDLHEALNDLCKQRGMRFTSCIPAIMLAVRSADRRTNQILTWTEGTESCREGSVHMLAFRRGVPVHSWRAWLSPHAGDFAGDTAVAGAERRFQAFAGLEGDSAPRRMHWPVGFCSP